MKLVVTLDHMLKNKYKAPSTNQLKAYGHDLVNLYEAIKRLSPKEHKNKFHKDQPEYNTLEILSSFSKTDRYYNLDNLKDASNSLLARGPFIDLDYDDPMTRILFNIMSLYRTNCRRHIRDSRLQKDWSKADESQLGKFYRCPLSGGLEMLVNIIQTNNFVHYGKGHFNYTIIRYINFITYVLDELVSKCHEYEDNNNLARSTLVVPYLYEFFPIRYTTKESALKKKRWI